MGSNTDADDLVGIKGLELIRSMGKRSLSHIIHDTLRTAIVRGEIPIGNRLVEERVARFMGASRTPVREALQRLAQEGFIEKLPYGGYKIREVTVGEIEEIFGIRSILESYAAALATRRVHCEVMGNLEQIIERSRETLKEGDLEGFIALNTEFHDCLYRASGSKRLWAMIHQLRDHFHRYRKAILSVHGMPGTSLRDHEMMMEAMCRGDEAAVETQVRDHILRGMKLVLREIEEGRLAL
jgi:DNA-binding GntR family transcriptional regulator